MAWRSAVRIELDEAERCELEARTRRRKISRADAMRAEIVLLAADGTTNLAIAEQLGVTRVTVATWRKRFAARRLDGDREIGRAIGRQKHDLGPHRVGTRYLLATCSRLKLTPLGLVQLDPNRRSPGHCRLLDRAPTRKKARNGFTG